jgi:hypothetical protein
MAGPYDNPTIHNEGINRMRTLITLLTVMLFMTGNAMAQRRPITIIAPDGSMTVCSVCSDGRVIICT